MNEEKKEKHGTDSHSSNEDNDYDDDDNFDYARM